MAGVPSQAVHCLVLVAEALHTPPLAAGDMWSLGVLLLVLLKRRLPFGTTGLAPDTIMQGAVLSVDQLQQCIEQQLSPLMQQPQVSRAVPSS